MRRTSASVASSTQIRADRSSKTVVHGNETSFVTLSNATNAAIGRGQGRGTIVDDDR